MKHNKISVFEYDRLKIGNVYNGVPFTENLQETLECFHASSKTKYFNLIHNGVEFCEYVGVLQVGSIQIEVLPKMDKNNEDNNVWRDRLIGMLKEVGLFRVSAPSNGMLTLRPNSILELYFDIFITEVEYLVRTGLVKQYRKQTLNHTALKGSLDFPGHIAKNLVHKERFYTKTSVYDHDHVWHSIIRETIDLIRILSQNTDLHNRIGALNLNFPEISQVRISEQTFNNLIYTRKTEAYRASIEIARLLLLRFHPDLAAGNNHVLALMFDMNLLWESFVYHSLRKQFIKHSAPYSISAQTSTSFWRASNYWRTLRPDILIKSKDDDRRFVLDTKWKNVSNTGPSSSDLQQLFAYSQFFFSSKNALLYPCRSDNIQKGRYALTTEWSDDIMCSIINLGLELKINQWQEAIYIAITDWMHDTEAVCL